jgi:hypothetical protein
MEKKLRKIEISKKRINGEDFNVNDLSEKDRVYFEKIIERVVYVANHELECYQQEIINYLNHEIFDRLKSHLEYHDLTNYEGVNIAIKSADIDGIRKVANMLKEQFEIK